MKSRYKCTNRVTATVICGETPSIKKYFLRQQRLLKARNPSVILDFLDFPENIFAYKTSLDKICFEDYDTVLLYIGKERLKTGVEFALLVNEFAENLIIVLPKDTKDEEVSGLSEVLGVPVIKMQSRLKTSKKIAKETEEILVFENEKKAYRMTFLPEIEKAINNIEKSLKENLACLFKPRFVATQMLMGKEKRVSHLRYVYGAGFDNATLWESLQNELVKLKENNLTKKKLGKIYEQTVEKESEKIINTVFMPT